MILPSLLSGLVIVICILNIITKSNTQSPGDIRLVGLSSSAGRVEIYYRGVWGTVCDDYWDMKEGAVVCRQLGYSAAVAVYSNAHFGQGSGNIWMDDIRCNGTELRLSDCSYNGWGVHDCSHSEDAGVACQNYTRKTLSGGGSCSFESGPALCGYTNTYDDNFDWTLHSGSTLSSNTGPPYDHTTGYGHYIYIESSYPRRQGDRARLLSPQITGGKCLEFYHHMKGSHIGELNVYVEYGNNKTMLWQRVGEQSHIWMLAKIPIYGLSTFKILFEGVVGSGYEGDIALDDIQILNETCIPDNSGNCTFDDGNLCGYTNSKGDDFDWTLHSGSTPTYNTGPQRDHTTGTGNYIYIVTSWPKVSGQLARLISPEIFGAKCIQFYYHMKGRGIGELNVYIDNGISNIMVWQLTGEQSSYWKKGMLPINGLRAFKIIFEGVVGSDYRGNIALDDIIIHNTTCAVFPSKASTTPINITSITHTVRLVQGNDSSAGSSAGRIEVLHNGRWGTVCGNRFPLASARVVCRQLGFSDVEMLVPCCSIFQAGGGRILLDDVRCRGDEPAISMCSHKGWGVSSCSHSQDAGVICKAKTTFRDVRLRGSNNTYEGRVEVQIGGIWGTVSDLGWDIYDADVFCREMGFKGATGVYNGAHYGRGSGPVWISNAACNGDETAIWKCNLTLNRNPRIYSYWWWNPHRRDAGVECYDLRLTGGRTKSEGIIEMKYLGIWGTICNDGWDMNDAKVVCRQMGYSRAVSLALSYSASLSAGINPIITRLQCRGTESSIGLCAYQTLLSVTHQCTHLTDAQVVCAGPLPTASPVTTIKTSPKVPGTIPPTVKPGPSDVRLVGSPDKWQGRIEIFHSGKWGTICDDRVDISIGKVVCRQLGYTDAIAMYPGAAFGKGKGTIWLHNVRCKGSESGLTKCQHSTWNEMNAFCTHLDDLGVACAHSNALPSTPGGCSFDNDLCGYTNANDDDFDWTRHQNSTPSFNTGPAHDHSTGYGNYIYIETSWPRVQGEMARIISPQLRDIKCVKFFYSMKGDSVNELSVYVDDGNDRKMVWQMRGEVSGVWEKAVIPIKGYSMFKVVFEGLVGTQHTGDIAIDDVSAVTTSCDALFPGNAKPNPPDLSKLNNTIRLVGGNVSSAGRIEVLHNNRWGTVCGSHFHLTAAKVVCRQLGFLDVETLVPCCLIHKPGKGTIWLDNLHCEGREPAINMCPHKGWGITRCLHTQDIGVICKTKNTLKQVRLAGSKNKYEGRVEIQIGGIWGTIMDYGWDIYDSTVICRQLGYSGASAVYSGARFGPGKGPIWLSAAQCIGNETLFSQCNVTQHHVQWQQHWWWNPHRRDASTECYNLKLTGGKSKSEGLVEIQYLGNWGTICNELWDINDAQVICRQMGYSKVVSYKRLGYSPKPSNGSVPVLTRLKCKGDEVALGLCASDLLLSIKHSCTHDNDVMVKCDVPFPTASPPGPTPPNPGCASNCPTCLTNKRHGGICLCSSSENTNKITCDGKKDDCQVDVRFTKITMKDWDAVKYKAKLADQLSKYCKTSSCGTNVSSTFTPDDIIFVGKPTVFNKHLILQFVVINPNPKSKTPISQMTIKNMINKDNNLGGYSVILENPRVAAQKGSGNIAKIVVPIVVVLVVFGVALVVFIIYRKRMALGSGGSASQRYLHLSHDDRADDHDDPLLTMDDDDIAPSTERT